MDSRTIPAFYCCYLLRSSLKPRSVYVGSTPNPRRRLQQHNSKDGAKRTRSKDFHPWIMECVVTGFPSQVAALQFEWAWQNPHLTKRIPPRDRITLPVLKKGRSGRERMVRPTPNMSEKLRNLHLLIRVPSFARWPLKVRFFNTDVWQKWHYHTKKMSENVPSAVNAALDLKMTSGATEASEKDLNNHEKGKRRREAIGKGGVEGLDVGYTSILTHLAKSDGIFRGDLMTKCAVCDEPIDGSVKMSVICPHEHCTATSHTACLAKRFLSCEEPAHPLLPVSGYCPKCERSTQWIDLVKEMTLRARDEKEVAQLMRKPGMRKIKTGVAADPTKFEADLNSSDEEDAEEIPDEPLADDWFPQDQEDGDNLMSASSVVSEPSTPAKTSALLPTVIEDSEWDDVETLD